MSFFTRRRLLVAAAVAAFLAAFAAIGAVSRSSPKAAAPSVAGPVPNATWYWTMVVSPTDEDVLVLGTSSGIFRSTDGGRTWRPTGPKGVHATSLVQADGSILMGGVVAPARGSPLIRKGVARVAPDGPAVLAESTDDGETWRKLKPRGLPNVSVQALAADPTTTSGLYALLNTGGLYRSTDGGRSFRLVVANIGIAPFALAITHGGRFLAGDMDTGHHVSANGKVWQRTRFKDSKGSRMVMEYAVAPDDSTRVLMSEFGIVMSTDGGKTWKAVLKTKTDVMFGPVAWAPTKPTVAYAVGFDRSFWRSDDRGASWTRVS
jgi:photosystem II stability/assembly factor-like uncharacterized protein